MREPETTPPIHVSEHVRVCKKRESAPRFETTRVGSEGVMSWIEGAASSSRFFMQFKTLKTVGMEYVLAFPNWAPRPSDLYGERW